MSQKKSRIILKNIEKYSSLNFLQKLNETAFKIIKAKLLKLINYNFHSILKHWFTCLQKNCCEEIQIRKTFWRKRYNQVSYCQIRIVVLLQLKTNVPLYMYGFGLSHIKGTFNFKYIDHGLLCLLSFWKQLVLTTYLSPIMALLQIVWRFQSKVDWWKIQNVYLVESIITIESDERVAYKFLLVHTLSFLLYLPYVYLHAMWVNVQCTNV